MFRQILGVSLLGLNALGLAACTQVTPAQLCEQTVRDYAVLRDDGPVEAYADLFTNDGTFQLGETVVEGRDALIGRHKAANSAAAWRHTMGDIRVSELDGEITGHSRFVVRTGASGSPTTVTREIVGYYEDTFVIEAQTCKIATRKVHILFDTSS